MTRVLLSAYACLPGQGSESGSGWNWACALAACGHEVTCFTSGGNRAGINRGLEILDGPRPKFEFVDLPPRKEARYPKRIAGFEWGNYYHYLAWQRALGRMLSGREGEFDVAHHVTWGSLQLGSGVAGHGVPLIYGPLGGGQKAPVELRRYFASTWAVERARDVISKLLLLLNPPTRRAIRESDVVLCTNGETAELARRHGARNVELFSDFALPAEFFPEAAPVHDVHTPLRLLWIGRVFERKGLALVLDAVAEASKSMEVSLTVVGDGPEHGGQVQRAKDLGIEDRVEFMGRVDWQSIGQVCREHDVLVFCTLRDSYGAQFLEAMAWGLPVVCLDQSGPATFLPDDSCRRVPVSSPEVTIRGIASAIVELAEPATHRAASAAAWAFAATQTWEHHATTAGVWYRRAQKAASVIDGGG